jgi:putative transposase
MNGYLSVFQVFTMLLAEKFRPRYDARLQLLAYQVKMLRSRIDDERIYTKPEERAELMRLGELLGHDVADAMLVVKPDTYKSWLKPKEEKQRKPGRPRTAEATVNLILRIASENLTWGYKKLYGELRKLGIKIGLSTISDILRRAGHHSIPEKGSGRPPSDWKLFISSHMETLVATDFFTKPVLTWRGWVDAYVLVFIHIGSRRVFMSPATFNPTEDWVIQQSRIMPPCGCRIWAFGPPI